MFTRISDGSKMALSALVQVCLNHGIDQIDCQQNTPHLATLGAKEMERSDFLTRMAQHRLGPSPDWRAQVLDGFSLAQMATAP